MFVDSTSGRILQRGRAIFSFVAKVIAPSQDSKVRSRCTPQVRRAGPVSPLQMTLQVRRSIGQPLLRRPALPTAFRTSA